MSLHSTIIGDGFVD